MIQVDELTFSYPEAEHPAIHGLSFDVQEGEVFGFLGPSGAGKSTTQNILIGLLRGWQGEISVLGKPLGAWGGDYYRRIGVSFELPNHYLSLTARENLEHFRALYDGDTDPVDEVLDRVGLLDDADKVVDAFSKGMKNRLNFARSLLHRPRLWFLDEPTSGLDPVNAVRVRDIVRKRQSAGVTTVITTHDMHTAQTVCDRVAFIVDGQIVALDSPDALRRAHGKREVEVTFGDDQSERFELDGLGEDEAFLAAIKRDDLLALHSQEATLEDVFVAVTGRSLT